MRHIKLKVSNPVLDYDDKPIQNGDKPLLWRDVIFQALNGAPSPTQTAEDKAKCYQITMKAYKSNEPDFTLSERNFILEKVRHIYNALVCGRAEEFFDQSKPDAPQAN